MLTAGHKWWLSFLAISLAYPNYASSCDLCGCYTPQLETMTQAEMEMPYGQPMDRAVPIKSWFHGFYGAVGEQFTHFGTVQIDGEEAPNPTDQHLDSSITQLVIGWGFNARVALQLNVPLIYRSFQRPEGFAIDRGTESGLGDMSLLGKYVLFHTERGGARSVEFDDSKAPHMQMTSPPDFTFSAILLTGVKFPTGNTSRLEEEFHEIEVPGAPVSGIHGHDLTLGTGSWDGIFGGQAALRYRRAFALTDIQFTLRGDGAHQYHFANDLTWSGGPGFYVIQTRQTVVGVQAVVSGEYKDVDRFRGKVAEDTGVTSVFLGPRVIASFGRFSVEIEADLPVSIDNTALQVVPDYRIRGGLAVHF